MKSRTAYHHGALRAALLKLAEAALEARGREDLSIRELAAAAEVASSAPYRHFKSKDDLLAALARSGFDQLNARYETALEDTAPLRALCVAYLDFALERPQLFRLMFGAGGAGESGQVAGGSAAVRAFELFESGVRRSMPGRAAEAVRLRSLTIWAAKHGAALLLLDGKVDVLLSGPLTRAHLVESVVALAGAMATAETGERGHSET